MLIYVYDQVKILSTQIEEYLNVVYKQFLVRLFIKTKINLIILLLLYTKFYLLL